MSSDSVLRKAVRAQLKKRADAEAQQYGHASGGDFNSFMNTVGNIAGTVGKVLPLFGLGLTGASNHQILGHDGHGTLIVAVKPKPSKITVAGGSFLDNIPVIGNIAHIFGLGLTGASLTGAGKKKSVASKPKKATKSVAKKSKKPLSDYQVLWGKYRRAGYDASDSAELAKRDLGK